MAGTLWRDASLVALDLEGTGAQDRENEAMLEIAVVPIVAGRPHAADAYCTLVNPGRAIVRRPWISPGLTNEVLASAPALAEIAPALATKVDGRYLVGHNIGVDWRLLHRRCPDIAPTGLIDTLRLARHLRLTKANGLEGLVDHLGLTADVDTLAAGSQPHRALWDAVASAVLLRSLIGHAWPVAPTLADLLSVATVPLGSASAQDDGQLSIF